MTKFEYINKNISRVKREVKMGLIPVGILRHYEIYSRFDYYIKQGHEICCAINFTGDDMRVCDRTVFRIIKNMEEIA